jgi:hypothetical protein
VPRTLFAPNHFHHLSIPRFAARYPEARIVAGQTAIPRLRKKTGLSRIEAAEGASFLECRGTKTGETWLSLEAGGERTWVVCDAFFHVTREVTGAMGFALRATKTLPGLSIGNTFRWLALRDQAEYREWAQTALAGERPARLVVSHGEPVSGPGLNERLESLLRSRLR